MGFGRRITGWFDGRRRLVLGGFLTWVVVAAASAGGSPAGRGWVDVPDLSAVLVVLFVGFAAFSLAVYVMLLRGERTPTEQTRRRPTSYWLIAAIFLTILVVLRSLSDDVDDGDVLEEQPQEVGTTAVPEASPGGGEETSRPVDRAEIVVAAALAGLAGALWWSLRRATDEPEHSPEPTLSAEPAIDQAIADLDLGDDPRRAILAAYATLERAFATQGVVRRPAETAAEHLTRTLGTLSVDHVELRELGRLYERARFSDEELSASDRDRARVILDTARHRMRPAGADSGRVRR